MKAHEKIIVALDAKEGNDSIGEGSALVRRLYGKVGMFKIGLSLQARSMLHTACADFTQIKKTADLFAAMNGKVMYDGKFHDIPSTVREAARAIDTLGMLMFTVSALPEQRRSVREAVRVCERSKVIGVSLLTSLGEEECRKIFNGKRPQDIVLECARMLCEEGADGIVCSPRELVLFRTFKEFDSLLKIVPGIRPEWATHDDQARVMTPAEAVLNGADYLVIGRPITNPPPPLRSEDALARITAEIEEVLS